MTPDELAARTTRTIEAAAAAGSASGLTVTEPTALYDAFSVVVHLRPAPVVARVPVILPPSLSDPAAATRRQQTELDVAQWLFEQGRPVVRPSPLVPRRPVRQDGLSMTFWEYVDADAAAEPDYAGDTRRAVELHAALAEYPGELPWLAPVAAVVPEGLEQLSADTALLTQEDVDRARREWDAIAPMLTSREGFARAFPDVPVQPIHGDAPSYNVIRTTGGTLWSDFEDVSVGPREWDVAGFGPEYAAIYSEAAVSSGRPPLDAQVQRLMDLARTFQILICLPLVPQLPVLADSLAPFVEEWRTSPFAAGLV